MRNRRTGFTLVELLVVITIIVILLALLTPALDKAIYQAELAVCAANLRGIGLGVNSYAVQNKRVYPYRNLEKTWWKQVEMLADRNNGYDVRPRLAGYISWGMFVDPLTGKVKLGPDDTLADSQVFSPYALWFGLSYPGLAGLKRIGDRLTWTEASSQGPATWSFDVLAADQDLINDGSNIAGSHSDNTDVLSYDQVLQDVDAGGAALGDLGLGVNATSIEGRFTVSRWLNTVKGQYQRGPIDRNFVFGDGSVSRLTALAWNDYETSDRTVKVPGLVNASGYPAAHDALPPHSRR